MRRNIHHGRLIDPALAGIAAREGVAPGDLLQRLDAMSRQLDTQARLLKPAKEARQPKPGDRYVALRTFGYCGQQLDRGQLFVLRGAVNDEALHRLGYCTPYDVEDGTPIDCRGCGGIFLSVEMRDGHAALRHGPAPSVPAPPVRDPAETSDEYQNRYDQWAFTAGAGEDAAADASMTRDDVLAPLRLDRSAASRE